jgi:hypothetical protein
MVAWGMRGIIIAGILATTALVAVCVVLSSSTSWGAQQDSSPTTGGSTNRGGSSCSRDEWQVKTFTGTQNQSTPQFVIAGPKWRVIIYARATNSGVGHVTVSAKGDEGGEIGVVGSVSAPPHERLEGPTVSSDLIDGPDIFSLDIEVEDAEYAVRVCERQVQPSPSPPSSSSSGNEPGSEPLPQPPSPPPARTTPGSKGETAPEESAAQPPPPPARTTPPAGQPQSSSPSPAAPGLNSGGAHSGPVRLMANGGCPKELPVKKDGACFLR